MQTTSFSREGPASLMPTPAVGLLPGAVPALDMQAKADEAAALLKALANRDRLLLLCQLVDGERSVTALGGLTGIEQPSLSQQLGVLRGERLVATHREGKHIVYRIASPAALAVLQTLYGLYCDPASSATPRRAAIRSKKESG